MRILALVACLCLASPTACKNSDADPVPASRAVSVPASSDPTGADLVEGAVIASFEKVGGVRLYKLIEVKYFPPPMSDALIMIAYTEKGADYAEAARLWNKGGLSIVVTRVDVQRNVFRQRDYRVLSNEPVTDADRNAKPTEP